MYLFYILALIPLAPSIILWLRFKEIHIAEGLGGVAIAFAVAGIFHISVLFSQLHDTETISGTVVDARYIPPWVSEHEHESTSTDDKGNTTTTTWTTYDDEGDICYATCDFGKFSREFVISKSKYAYLVEKFGQKKAVGGYRPDYYKGDRNDYVAVNVNNWIEPVADTQSFQNHLKNSKTLFSHIEVPSSIVLPQYPTTELFNTNRLIGGIMISEREFNLLNAFLGPRKKVNLIMMKFHNQDSMMGRYLEAKWIGGKKNDLVITYGVDANNVISWAYVFGWTEQNIVKRNIEAIMMNHAVDNSILPLLKTEIIQNYTIKDWSKFDYITVEPPYWAYPLFMGMMLLVEGVYFFWAFSNQFDKFGLTKNKIGYNFRRR